MGKDTEDSTACVNDAAVSYDNLVESAEGTVLESSWESSWFEGNTTVEGVPFFNWQIVTNYKIEGRSRYLLGLDYLVNRVFGSRQTNWIVKYSQTNREIGVTQEKLDKKQVKKEEKRLLNWDQYNHAGDTMSVATTNVKRGGTVNLFRLSETIGSNYALDVASSLERISLAKDIPDEGLKEIGLVSWDRYYWAAGTPVLTVVGDKNGGVREPPITGLKIHLDYKGNYKPTPKRYNTWKSVLRMKELENDDYLMATIPQMMGLLHLHGYDLAELEVGPIEELDDKVTVRCATGRLVDVHRAVRLLKPPKSTGDQRNYPKKVAVSYSRKSAWTREPVLWV